MVEREQEGMGRVGEGKKSWREENWLAKQIFREFEDNTIDDILETVQSKIVRVTGLHLTYLFDS